MIPKNKIFNISVIIPVYNGEKYLSEAINSVIKQNYHPLEIILIDDGSTDNTAKIAQSFPDIKYIYQENSGVAMARNRGVELAKGEYIAFIDADDLWTDNHLQLLISQFQINPNLEVAIGYVQWLLLKGKKEGKEYFEEFSNSPINLNLGAALYKKSLFDQLGNFNSELKFCEDVDWFLRIKKANINTIQIPEITLYYPINENNMTKNRQKNYSYFLKALKISLDRRKTIT